MADYNQQSGYMGQGGQRPVSTYNAAQDEFGFKEGNDYPDQQRGGMQGQGYGAQGYGGQGYSDQLGTGETFQDAPPRAGYGGTDMGVGGRCHNISESGFFCFSRGMYITLEDGNGHEVLIEIVGVELWQVPSLRMGSRPKARMAPRPQLTTSLRVTKPSLGWGGRTTMGWRGGIRSWEGRTRAPLVAVIRLHRTMTMRRCRTRTAFRLAMDGARKIHVSC